MSLNLAKIVETGQRVFPDQVALIHPGGRLTYHKLADNVCRLAAALSAQGIKRGDKVGLMIPNRPEFTIAYYAILHLGAVVVPLNILLVADEVAYTLSDSDAVAMVGWAPLEAGLRGFERVPTCKTLFVAGAQPETLPPGAVRFDEAIERANGLPEMTQTMPDDTAVILYTSGTTGRPKGAELTHANLFLNALCVSERQFSRWPHQVEIMGPGQVGLAVLPLYHSFGQTAIQNGMLFGGAAVRYVERFDAETALAAIQDDRVTFFAGVPTMYFAILAVPDAERRYDLSSLRYCVSGGAALPVEVKRAFEERFKVRIQEAYGLSETSPLACSQEVDRTHKAGSIGRPIWGIEMTIADDAGSPVPTGQPGEVLIRGHNIMKGYYKRPDATAEAMRGGWFHSGDIGRMDKDGDFYIVDRKKDMIIRGGFNVYPREVEEVLYQHPAVREAAVVGMPDEKYGEEVKAVIALHAGRSATPEEIIAFCKLHMAAYKYPRVVQVVDELPKGPTGKILRRELRGA
ncbi:MAG: long-chain fatty acid--CoA ligase [Planctomycetes bacterium]|nr:long-chain fatty acid--CoA ligase [Planctomycetota bacterium]